MNDGENGLGLLFLTKKLGGRWRYFSSHWSSCNTWCHVQRLHHDLPIDFNGKFLEHFKPECSFDIWIQGEKPVSHLTISQTPPPPPTSGMPETGWSAKTYVKRMTKTLNIEITCDVTFALKRIDGREVNALSCQLYSCRSGNSSSFQHCKCHGPRILPETSGRFSRLVWPMATHMHDGRKRSWWKSRSTLCQWSCSRD